MELLSIVLITRNEERNVEKSVESALRAAALVPGTETVLVDSASVDATCSVAARYPITVVQLRPKWRLTPAAGRYIGTLQTSGEYILFLDGDMVLCADWLDVGIPFLQANPRAAAVSGELDEVYVGDRHEIVGIRRGRYATKAVAETRGLGGVGLYRRSALAEVGTFNPFVPLREEAELGLRLRQAGYKLYRTPVLIAIHYSPPRQTVRELVRRYRAGYYAGFGRALYYSTRNSLGWQFLREQGLDYLYTGGYLLLGIGSLLLAVLTSSSLAPLVWVALTMMLVSLYAVRKDSLREAVLGLAARVLTTTGGMAGMLSALGDPPSYPTDVLILKRAPEGIAGSLNRNERQASHDKPQSIALHDSGADHGRVSL